MTWRSLFGIPETRDSIENPSVNLSEALTMAPATASGVSVSGEGALRMISVYAAVRVLSEGVGSLPFHTYSRTGVRVSDDPRARMLNEEPNPEMTAMTLWETVMGHLNLWGNAYLYKEANAGSGLVRALWPLRPDRTRPLRNAEGKKVYVTYLDSGEERVLLADEVIHIVGWGTAGDIGISPIGVGRQAIGTAIAADDYAGRFFANDARPGGIIQFEGKLSDEQWRTTMQRWKAGHQGLTNSHLAAILDNGAEWIDVGIPPKDAQFLELRKFQVREIARLFNVPPHKIGDLDQATFSNIEQQSLDFVTGSLRPWLVRIEQQVNRHLFGSELDRRRGLFAEFRVEGLLRGDSKARSEFYASAIQNGWMTRNEARELENLAVDDPELDKFLYPTNLAVAGEQAEGESEAMAAALLSGNRAIAAQRWGLAAQYGIVAPEEVRPELGFEGDAPEPTAPAAPTSVEPEPDAAE